MYSTGPKKFQLRSSKTLQSRFHVGKKTLNDLKKTATFFYAPEFFYPTVVYFLLIYASLTICADNLFFLRPLIASLKQRLFFATLAILQPRFCKVDYRSVNVQCPNSTQDNTILMMFLEAVM